MKKLIYSLLILFSSNLAFAQWTTSGSNIYYNSGNVGIGVISPVDKLDINGNISTNGILKISKSGAGGAQLRLYNTYGSSEDWRIQAGIPAISDNTLAIQTISNSTTHFAIKNDGSVGIGTSSPTGKFQSYISATRYFGHNVNGADLSVLSDNNTAPVFKVVGTGNADLVNILDGSTEVFTIKDGGQVGIGTTSPSVKLEVNGNALFQGNIESMKVKVTQDPGNWPDYVFSPNFKLRTLTELETYIQQNQHLPEVPSAKEIEANGQDLGDIQAVLLKKIEELTLYLIQENKENSNLKEQITKVEDENQELREMLQEIKKEIETIKNDKQ
ncbi:hypothetical protein [Roseivirga thermotolerans]|uniref:Uncharacterized protein n=1 Tax=Roseivirga thermotolerans TaxID=1758176 RepID=A0ABQ3I605_9BACT|nr:hypothetical protein [Roseivirga thermotolerans]GHE56664.1 hypothetical protein GCM10011340_09520 [Roseivirga thermotolerans]